ncbi:MAG: putative nucleotide-diphospho-sugar transferase [Hyphomicrobiaceae bacterium]|nr:putative nucleotide-diphospho-sugar transferase [Hyphomicrobiaceae bacterium]
MISTTYPRNRLDSVTAMQAQEMPEALPAEVTWLDGGQRYVVCAFYTPNYVEQVSRLKASLESLGINHHLRRYERRSTWEATTRLKPGFVADCLARFAGQDVLYVDADAVLHQQPLFFDDVVTDVALLFAPVMRDRKRSLSIAAGTLYIRNTPGGRRFAETWARQDNKSGPLTLDEDMIYMAFPELEGVTFTALPRAYSKIFDSDGPVPVIEHFQASRRQFKLGKLLRKSRRAIIIAVVVLAMIAATMVVVRALP